MADPNGSLDMRASLANGDRGMNDPVPSRPLNAPTPVAWPSTESGSEGSWAPLEGAATIGRMGPVPSPDDEFDN